MSELIKNGGFDFSRVQVGDVLVFTDFDLARISMVDCRRLWPMMHRAACNAGFFLKPWRDDAARCWRVEVKEAGAAFLEGR